MSITTKLSFIHRFRPASQLARPTLLLLHGTGGNEDDLLQLGEAIAPGSALLSPRGQVLEDGMPRFFRRLREGVFDEQDVRRRANELADFIADARHAYSLPAPFAVGFSNGASVAAAVLQLRPMALAGAVLLRVMTPLHDPPTSDLRGKPILIISGAADPIVPAGNASELVARLTTAGAVVQHRVLAAGHGLAQADVSLAKTWIDQL